MQDGLELLDQKFPPKSEVRSMKFHRIPTLKRSVGTGRREPWERGCAQVSSQNRNWVDEISQLISQNTKAQGVLSWQGILFQYMKKKFNCRIIIN